MAYIPFRLSISQNNRRHRQKCTMAYIPFRIRLYDTTPRRKNNVLADTLSRYFKNPARLPPIIRKPDQNKQQQQQQATTTSKNQQSPLYPLYLYLFKISHCLPMHRSSLLRSASSPVKKNRLQLFLPQLRSLPVPHHGLRKRRNIIRMNGMTLTSFQRPI